MNVPRSLPVLLSIIVSGCASLADLTAKQEAKPVCCKSVAEFKYEPLSLDATTTLSLGDESSTFTFPSGKSYFKAYALPLQRRAAKLRVRSYATGSTAFETKKLSQLYCPQVTFVDASYQTLASDETVPTVARGALATGLLPSFIAEFEVPPGATYVVLHTNPTGYGRLATRYTGGGGYMVGSTFVMERGGEPIHHPCGPTANAEISLL